jgi:hypothetical protein
MIFPFRPGQHEADGAGGKRVVSGLPRIFQTTHTSARVAQVRVIYIDLFNKCQFKIPRRSATAGRYSYII